jgi:competence protein ComEC
LHAAGVNQIRGLLLSHGDSLHIGGGEPLLQDFLPRILIDNPAADRSAIHRRLRRLFADRHISSRNLFAGENLNLTSNVIGRILFPPRQFVGRIADDETLVVQLSIAPATKILFMSDSGNSTENAILASGADLRSDIVIKGQHHSGKSGSDAFLDAVQPQLIIATSRDFPEYERMSDEWAEHVRARGTKLFRQDETGAVELRFGEHEWSARAYVTGETFRSVNR